jgi:ornithine cyclodeaminase/alanine dehydrogenase-like protein (mu-crystallin family)
MSTPAFLSADELARLLPPADAVDALEAALRAGLDPVADPPRSSVSAQAGELLLMPSTAAGALGVKLATVARDQPGRTLPRVQGVYVLFDPESLAPAVVIDGIALTELRTSAVSALAVRHLANPDAHHMLVFGTGPQAWAHVEAMRAIRPIERVHVAARDPARLAEFVNRCRATELEASAEASGQDAPIADVDLICCCTTAREPLFDGRLPRAEATVVAIGSHEPRARELDELLLGRATVVVEDRDTAMREAGDVILAVEAGAVRADDLLTLADLVRGAAAPAPGKPRVFKSTGMAWEDAVVAAAAVRRGQ